MTEIRVPKLGMSMTEATLVEWLVADGTEVTEGQDVYAIETDKSVQDIAAPSGGRLTILGQAGETYPVGHLIARLD